MPINMSSANAASTSVNLTTEGTEDWFIPAANPTAPPRAANPVPPSKQLGGGALLLNFDWLTLGSAPTAFNQACTITRTATSTDNVQGATINTTGSYGFFHASNLNYGFRFRARADASVRTLRIYEVHFTGVVTVTAHLMDGSEANVVQTHDSGNGVTAERKWTITYNAPSVTELVVTVLLTSQDSANSHIKLAGATLALDSIDVIDIVEPVITTVSEPVLPTDPLVIELYDEVGLRTYHLSCRDRDGAPRYVIYDPTNAEFCHPFGGRSTITGAGTEGNPYVVTIYRRGGWPTDTAMDILAQAVDIAGNETTG